MGSARVQNFAYTHMTGLRPLAYRACAALTHAVAIARFRASKPSARGEARTIVFKRTDEGLRGRLPREVADVAAGAVGGGGVADGGSPVAAALGGGGLGGRLVLADGDVAIAEGVTWSEWMGVKKDRSASCSVFRGKSDARGRDRAPQGGRSSRDNSFIRGSRNRNAWPKRRRREASSRPHART